MYAQQRCALDLLIDIVNRTNVRKLLITTASPLVMTAYLSSALTDIFRKDGRHDVVNIELVGNDLVVYHTFNRDDVETAVPVTAFTEALKSLTGVEH